MTKASASDDARKAFADITATLEDLTVLASEDQSAPDISATRQLIDQLIRRHKFFTVKIKRLRRPIG